jgi:hypothetical protein
MACVEAALNDKGFAHLRHMLQTAVASHDDDAGAQKKGSRVYRAPAANVPPCDAGGTRRS